MLVESILSLAMLPLLLLPLLSLLLRYVKDIFFIFTLYKLGKIALHFEAHFDQIISCSHLILLMSQPPQHRNNTLQVQCKTIRNSQFKSWKKFQQLGKIMMIFQWSNINWVYHLSSHVSVELKTCFFIFPVLFLVENRPCGFGIFFIRWQKTMSVLDVFQKTVKSRKTVCKECCPGSQCVPARDPWKNGGRCLVSGGVEEGKDHLPGMLLGTRRLLKRLVVLWDIIWRGGFLCAP